MFGAALAADGQGTIDDAWARLSLLAEVSDTLIRTLDTGQSADHLARLVVPRLADWATVTVLAEDGADQLTGRAHRDPDRLPDLDTRARSEIARTVRRVVDKLLHEPTVRVKELASSPGGTDYADALRALFGLGIGVDGDTATLSDAVTLDPGLPAGTRLSALDLRTGVADARPGGAG